MALKFEKRVKCPYCKAVNIISDFEADESLDHYVVNCASDVQDFDDGPDEPATGDHDEGCGRAFALRIQAKITCQPMALTRPKGKQRAGKRA